MPFYALWVSVLLFINFVSANSYEDETVYTQALLEITYKSESPQKTDKMRGVGKFGKDSPKSIERGFIIWLEGRDWCRKEPVVTPHHQPWIALIPKGNCSIVNKLLNAQRHNASAVIVYDNEEQGDIPPLSHKGSGTLVTVMIQRKLGHRIIRQYNKNPFEPMDCIITVGTHYVDRKWKVSRTSVLFVLVSFILLMCISLAWLVFYYVQRFRYIYRNDRKEKQLLNAAKKAISKLKTKSFHSNGSSEDDETCVVCLEVYRENDTLRVLPCNHEFHKGCIDPWLLNHRTCPMCKSNILKSLGVDIPENYSHSDQPDSPSNTTVAVQPAPTVVQIAISESATGTVAETSPMPTVLFTQASSSGGTVCNQPESGASYKFDDASSTTSSSTNGSTAGGNPTRVLITTPTAGDVGSRRSWPNLPF